MLPHGPTVSGFETARETLKETASEGQAGLTLADLQRPGDSGVKSHAASSDAQGWIDKNIHYVAVPTSIFAGLKEGATVKDVHRLMDQAGWESPFGDPKWRSTVRKTLDSRTRLTAHIRELEGAAAVEHKVFNRMWMRGAARGLAAAGVVLGTNELVDRTLFRGVPVGPLSYYSDMTAPAFALLRVPWPIKIAAMVGLHAATRYLEQ